MKTLQFLVFVCIGMFCINWSAVAASADESEEARKKAETEYKALSRKGWVVANGDMLEALVQNWEKRLAKDGNDIHVYVIAYGHATASDLAVAEDQALQEAREQIAGPMILYFHSWNNARESQEEITTEEAAAVRDAVNGSEDAIRQAYLDLNIPADLSMSRQQRSKHEVRIRLVYPQMELRKMAKEIIATRLQQEVGWDKERSFWVMTYPK